MKTLIKQLLRENLLISEEITAYHRSPYIFNKFDTSKIGSGTGEQIDGWGLYFSNHEPIEEYGKYLYQVKLFKGKDSSQYTLIDIDKPLEKDIAYKILKAVYQYYNKKFDIDKFNLYYDNNNRVEELKKILWGKLKKIDPNLNYVTLDEMMDVENKDSWYYITNYTENNNELKNIFYELISLSKINFNDYGFNINTLGGQLYGNLSHILGGDKNASLFLLKNGIDGLARTVYGNRNDYVIFDGNEVSIEKMIYPKY